MGVRLQSCFEIDLPTLVEKMLEQHVQKAQDGTYILHTSPRAFFKEFPMLIPYLVKDGWLEACCDFCLLVTPTPREEPLTEEEINAAKASLDESVAQQA